MAGTLGTTSLYFYGRHLINNGFLATGQAITKKMSNIQIKLDPQSEKLLADANLFFVYKPQYINELNGRLREYLSRFSVDKRHEFIQALAALQDKQRGKKSNMTEKDLSADQSQI